MTLYRVTTTMSGPQVVGGGINRLYFIPGGGTAAQAHSAVVAFWTTLATYMVAGNSIVIEGDVDELDEITGELTGSNSVTPGTATGGQAGDALPPTSQALIQFKTSSFVRGRLLRGRVFVPAMTEGNSTAGKPTSALVTAMAGAGTTLVGAANTELVIWQRPWAGDAQRPAYSGTQRSVTSATAWTEWAVQRSRRD